MAPDDSQIGHPGARRPDPCVCTSGRGCRGPNQEQLWRSKLLKPGEMSVTDPNHLVYEVAKVLFSFSQLPAGVSGTAVGPAGCSPGSAEGFTIYLGSSFF